MDRIFLVYRPPFGSVTTFLIYLESVLEYCCQSGLPAIFCGDFNIDLLSPTGNKQNLSDIFCSFGYQNVINIPTRITDASETLLDLCFTNYQPRECDAGVLIADLSDHLPFFSFFHALLDQT